jgi:hypothetical protein
MAAKTRETLFTSEFVLPQTGITKQILENAPDVGCRGARSVII